MRARIIRRALVKLLDRYLAGVTLRALIAVSLGLTSLLSLLEFVDQLHDVGEGRYHLIDAAAYVLLTAPSRFLAFMPVSIFFASLLALGHCANHSELIAMRAAGVSTYRLAGAIFKLTAVVVIFLFVLAQFVVPRAEQLAASERESKISSTSSSLRGSGGFWVEQDHDYLNVRRFVSGNVPEGITVYSFATNGSLLNLIRAEGAEVRGDGAWRLRDVTRTRFRGPNIYTDHSASLVWRPFLTPAQLRLLILPPSSMPPVQLFQYVRYLHGRHEPAGPYRRELWAMLDIPLAMAALSMLSVALTLGPPRLRGTAVQLEIGAVAAITFTIAQHLTAYLGLLFVLNPAVMAILPSLAVASVAISLFPDVSA